MAAVPTIGRDGLTRSTREDGLWRGWPRRQWTRLREMRCRWLTVRAATARRSVEGRAGKQRCSTC